MIIIAQNIGSLLKNIPKDVITKMNFSLTSTTDIQDNLEVVIIYLDKDKAREGIESLGGTFEDLGYSYAVATIPISNLIRFLENPSIQYVEFSKSIYFSDYDSNEASCINRAGDTYNLNGQGVLIGFIDSGIDYTHPAFLDDAGNTRVKYIYDLSSSIALAKEYNEQDINNAIKSSDPYSVVPVSDNTGHGTHVAGIAAAGGKIDKKYYGVAPKSSIMMVKSSRGYYSLSTSIMRGIKFLLDKSKELNMPLVINMSLSTNDGAHDGKSLLEQYINTVCDLNRVTVAVSAGNEGDAYHHISGYLKNNTIVKFNVAHGEFNVVINLYKSILPKISINLITPVGKSTGDIQVLEGYKEGVISGNKYQIYNSGPKPFDVIGEIGISINNEDREILSGLWTIEIKITNEYEGIYDMWLPIAEGLNKGTRFLNPTTENTLGIPATVYNVISVGSYNYQTSTISSFSGRGKSDLTGNIEPNIVAPGNGIFAPTPNNSYDVKTGTSMAAPHVSGAAALMMEWGIVKKNDVYLYGERLKYYMIIGAKRERRDVTYPDNSWGYGELCLYSALSEVIDALGIIQGEQFRHNKTQNKHTNFRRVMDTNKYYNFNEYYVNNLFVRIPKCFFTNFELINII